MKQKFWRNDFSLYICSPIAEIAQLVERNLAKVEVAGPSPVFRSKRKGQPKGCPFWFESRPAGLPRDLNRPPPRGKDAERQGG